MSRCPFAARSRQIGKHQIIRFTCVKRIQRNICFDPEVPKFCKPSDHSIQVPRIITTHHIIRSTKSFESCVPKDCVASNYSIDVCQQRTEHQIIRLMYAMLFWLAALLMLVILSGGVNDRITCKVVDFPAAAIECVIRLLSALVMLWGKSRDRAQRKSTYIASSLLRSISRRPRPFELCCKQAFYVLLQLKAKFM